MQQDKPGEVEHKDLMEENAGPLPGEWGVLLIMAYTGLRPKWGTFFLLQLYTRVGISQVEVYKKVGKSIIQVFERA